MDLQSATWTVPAERMKARMEHRVPLSGRSLEILSEARGLTGYDTSLVFPAGRSGQALSDMTLVVLLRRLGIPAVPHGFRGSFKNWCAEVRGGDDRWFVSEAALAHDLGNATAMPYAHTDLLDLRRPLMDEWAEFLSTP